MATEQDGWIYDYQDEDDGWCLDVFASGSRLFIRESDPYSGKDYLCVSCDRERLVQQVAPLRARCERILAELRQIFGHDYWNSIEQVTHWRTARTARRFGDL